VDSVNWKAAPERITKISELYYIQARVCCDKRARWSFLTVDVLYLSSEEKTGERHRCIIHSELEEKTEMKKRRR